MQVEALLLLLTSEINSAAQHCATFESLIEMQELNAGEK
jgi:hypothetical protein